MHIFFCVFCALFSTWRDFYPVLLHLYSQYCHELGIKGPLKSLRLNALDSEVMAWWYGWTCKSIFHMLSHWLVEQGDRMAKVRPVLSDHTGSQGSGFMALCICTVWCRGSDKPGIIRWHFLLFQCSSDIRSLSPPTVYTKMCRRLLIMLKGHLRIVYPPIHGVAVCSLVTDGKNPCKQTRWKTYGSKDAKTPPPPSHTHWIVSFSAADRLSNVSQL